MVKKVIGIDPGLNGGIAFISNLCSINSVIDMPQIADESEIDSREIAMFIKQNMPDVVYIEKAQAMPQQGVVGVFNYGKGYGKIIAACEIIGCAIKFVRPAIWKKHFSLSRDKIESVALAQQLFPNFEYETARGRMLDGRAEALLIAKYGLEMETKNDQQH